MARTVGNEGHLAPVRLAIRTRAERVESIAECRYDLEIRFFVPAADVVHVANLPCLKHAPDGRAVIGHVQPVAPLLAVAVDRQRFAGQRIVDAQRDQLFREVIRTVIVRAIGRQDRQAIGVVPGPHQMVAGGLAGRIRAVGLVAMTLAEGRVVLPQRTIDLVGRHVQEAECRLVRRRQAIPVRAHRLQQAEGADDIRLDEVFRAVDAAVDVALGGKIDDGARAVLVQQPGYQRGIADISLDEDVTRIAAQAGQVLEVAGIGQLVEVEHRFRGAGEPVQHKITADESGAARCEDHGCNVSRLCFALMSAGIVRAGRWPWAL
jgi:hypothetical protein